METSEHVNTGCSEMLIDTVELGPVATDDYVDDEIVKCLNPDSPKSFFLYAGAGSGKTRSLVKALTTFRGVQGARFRKSGQKVAVITYTNAACDEISSRVDEDPIFAISTVHSFCWSQIRSFHTDIQIWLKKVIPEEICDLLEKQSRGRAGTQAALDRERGIAIRNKRIEWLSVPRQFTYNPNGDNFGADSLSHSEVLKITAHFIETKRSMQAMLVNRFPVLLIDESQDTSKHLINALFALEDAQHRKFVLGLFGDMMQRIYGDGEPKLGRNIPKRWAKMIKKMNHRSPQRIIQLGNKLRTLVDNQRQMARDDSVKGIARLFIASVNTIDKPSLERRVRMKMSCITSDAEWVCDGQSVKILTLEHHMAASRMGFSDLFNALDQDSRLTTGLRSGDLAGVRFFSELVAPLINAASRQDKFAVMSILRNVSPLLNRSTLKALKNIADPLAKIRQATDALLKMDFADKSTTFMDVLKCISANNLFRIPESLKPFVDTTDVVEVETGEDSVFDTAPASLQAWRDFLETPYCQIIPYAEYVADIGVFGTHQGVKGLEFDRVLVVMDDSDARGFMFSYEKLLGTKPLSNSDMKKKNEGEEIAVDRTRRLLYVTCTRTKRSLALIAYTNAPNQLAKVVDQQGWFKPFEIELL